MTTRFSLAELGDMLHVPVDTVRMAVDALSAESELTAESFLYMDRNWRIAPSDVKRIQDWIVDALKNGQATMAPAKRRVRKREVVDTGSHQTE